MPSIKITFDDPVRIEPAASSGASVCGICCLAVVLTLVLSVNIAELVISHRYLTDATNDCHDDRLIRPALWLMWDGIIGSITVGVMILSFAISMCTPPLGMAITQLAWVVIGAVSFWCDNTGWSPSELNSMMYAALIIHFVFIGVKYLHSSCRPSDAPLLMPSTLAESLNWSRSSSPLC